MDGPDRWGKGWVGNGQECHTRFRRQQGEGGVIISASIIGDELVAPVRVPEVVKITSAVHCQLLKSALLPWLEDVSLPNRCKLIFQHDNAPSHSAKGLKVLI